MDRIQNQVFSEILGATPLFAKMRENKLRRFEPL